MSESDASSASADVYVGSGGLWRVRLHSPLVEFQQHATGLDARLRISRHPYADVSIVEAASRTASVPPAVRSARGAITASTTVVVVVYRAELGAVCTPRRQGRLGHGITGVSAVPGHRQLVLTNLITDGERRVFSRVPQTRNILDLLRQTYADLAV